MGNSRMEVHFPTRYPLRDPQLGPDEGDHDRVPYSGPCRGCGRHRELATNDDRCAECVAAAGPTVNSSWMRPWTR